VARDEARKGHCKTGKNVAKVNTQIDWWKHQILFPFFKTEISRAKKNYNIQAREKEINPSRVHTLEQDGLIQ
jgi:hypothetical protein